MRRSHEATVFISTSNQVVLSCLAENPGKELLPADVQLATGLSKAGTHRALKALEEQGLVVSETAGRMSFYTLNQEDMRVRQFKILKTIMTLSARVEALGPFVRKVVLFGSAARGEEGPDSDLDLFIVAKDVEEVHRRINGWKLKIKVQAVIKTAVEAVAMEKTDAVFLREVASGIVLWEEKDAA